MPKDKKILKGLGAKYGTKLRKKYARVYSILKMKRKCPSCGTWKLKRKSVGIWECKSCKFIITGRAYDIVSIKP